MNQPRLAALLSEAIERVGLDLSGLNVLTEAATGGYSVTPVLAAMANAKEVHAVTRSTRFGTVEDVTKEVSSLAKLCGVDGKIQILTEKTKDIVSSCDFVTNSGHLRPLDTTFVSWMKPGAVISLMYETWEFRSEDVDLSACVQRGIAVAGVNETHPAVDVFSYLPALAVRQLFEAGIPVVGTRILLLCNNRFEPCLRRGLQAMGAEVYSFESFASAKRTKRCDAVVVSQTPGATPVISNAEVQLLKENWPDAVVTQFFGDIDRAALSAAGIRFWPVASPPAAHMGVYMTDIGPDAIVRLQSGGLKVGEVLSRGIANASAADLEFVQALDRFPLGQTVSQSTKNG